MKRGTVSIIAIIMFPVGVTLLTDRAHLPGGWWAVTIELILAGVIVPFLLWNWLMGFVVFQHHTHPRVPWYGNEDDWSFYAGQVQSVVHIEMPRPVELVLHNIMEHTAHHVDPRIPLYNLEDAQKKLEHAYAGDIVVVPFTWRGYFHTLRTCRLFDYANHCWLDWNGSPTTEPLLRREDGGRLIRA